MAQTKLNLTCTLCGTRFVHVKQFLKRRDAQSYEDWAETNLKLCPNCFKNRKAREVDCEHWLNDCVPSMYESDDDKSSK